MTRYPTSGGPIHRRIPEGDSLPRLVCDTCGFIRYDNPKIVVGSVASVEDGRILLCRRAIEPQKGFWTLPAGYLELNETAEAGAQREAVEEACARVAIEGLLALYSIPRISQVQLIFRARLLDEAIGVGPESLEVALCRWAEIPWDRLAFPSVGWALHHHRAAEGRPLGVPFGNPPGQRGDFAPGRAAPASEPS
ncbi:MAG: NUDIX hydrolase [Alphaproteobacteria bacterium]